MRSPTIRCEFTARAPKITMSGASSPPAASAPFWALPPPAAVQTVAWHVQAWLQQTFCKLRFAYQPLLDGDVSLAWPETAVRDEGAPVVVLVPGITGHERNLPGTHLYGALARAGYRAVTYLKRGSAGPLRRPRFHCFGSVHDLAAAVDAVVARYPRAAVHVVSFSAGNGPAGFHACRYANAPNVRSYLLLCGASNYDHIENSLSPPPSTPDAVTARLRRVAASTIVRAVKETYVVPNQRVLRAHDAGAYDRAMACTSIQSLYDVLSVAYGGDEEYNLYRDPAAFAEGVRQPLRIVVTEDDPIANRVPPSWAEPLSRSSSIEVDRRAHGAHLACYEDWTFSKRWVDEYVLAWLRAHA